MKYFDTPINDKGAYFKFPDSKGFRRHGPVV